MNAKTVLFLSTATVLGACSAEPVPEAATSKLEPGPTTVATRVTNEALPDGAYLLEGVTVTENGEVSEYSRDQIKIYSRGRFMYAFQNEQTGSIDVGAGDASWKNRVMREVPRVNHDGPVSGYSFDVAINRTETGFEQTINDMPYEGGRLLDMVEVWNTVSMATSPFDGLWALETRESDDPDVTAFTETKMIGGGHFIWLQRLVYQGEQGQEFGFGSFTLNAAGNAVETAMVSSLADYEGTVNAVTMQLIDENHFRQSFTYNGKVITHSYVRL